MKGNKGITLIALVITIIVLLILAGVSIAMLSGDNSILGNARKASDDTVVANAKEATMLKVQEIMSDWYEGYYNSRTINKTLGAYIEEKFTAAPEGCELDSTNTVALSAATDASPAKIGIKIKNSTVTGTISLKTGEEGKITWSDAT